MKEADKNIELKIQTIDEFGLLKTRSKKSLKFLEGWNKFDFNIDKIEGYFKVLKIF